jgi:signal transduction histidine kinase
VCATLCVVAASPGARAQIAARAPLTDLGRSLEVHEDPSAGETIDDVARLGPGSWARVEADAPSFGFSRSAFWLRGSLALPRDGTRWLVEDAFAETDDVRVYWREGTSWREERSGDSLPFDARPIRAPTHVFEVPAVAAIDFAIRIRTRGHVLAPIRLWRGDAFARHAGDTQLLLGGFYAFLVALGLYNAFLFVALRDRAYAFYVLYLACFALFAASYEGHAAMYLWPRSPRWAHVAAPTFLSLAFAFGFLGLRRMANMPELAPRLARVTTLASAASFALAATSVVAYDLAVAVLAIASVPVMLFHVVPLLVTARAGWRPSLYLLAGHAFIFLGAVFMGLRGLGAIGHGLVSEHAVKLGVAIEALVVSFALADRIQLLREQKEAARASLERERRTVAARLLAAQDAERRRVASEIHDGLGQNLGVLAGELDRLEGGDGRLGRLVRESIADARAMAYDLHPEALDRRGLGASARALAARALEAAGVEAEIVVADVDGLLPAASELHVHRILQEALSNVARHARATSVIVVLRQTGDALELIVEDDGRGMGERPVEGLGTVTMRERAAAIGGTLEVSSPAEGGARVRLVVSTARVRSEVPRGEHDPRR